jgi:uncharacterized protein
VIFKTSRRNNYLYSSNFNQILLIHPILAYIIVLFKKGKHLDQILHDITVNEIKINGNNVQQKELLYYFKKFKFLAKKGFFKNSSNTLNKRYTGEDVKKNLSMTHQISFEVTDRCNLRCEYCIYGKYYSNHDIQKGINFDIKAAKNILDYLANLWNSVLNDSTKKINWIGFYGGEPLLNIKFISEIVDYSKTLALKSTSIRYTMTTNGLLLDKNMDFLVKNNFSLVISLDGGTESSNYYRKLPNNIPAFNKVYENILKLQKCYPDYFKNNVDFSSILHNRNYSYTSVKKYFKKTFNKEPNIAPLTIASITNEYKNDFLQMYRNSISKIIEKDEVINELPYGYLSPAKVSNFVEQYSTKLYEDYIELIDIEYANGYVPTGTCPPFSRKIFVTADGKIFPCEKIGEQYLLGTYNSSNINLDFDEIAEKYNYLFDNIIKDCKDCYLSYSCNKCVFRAEISIKTPRCKQRVDKNQFIQLLTRNVNYIEKQNKALVNITPNKISI